MMRKVAYTSIILKISIIFIIILQGALSSCNYKSNLKKSIRGIWSIDEESHLERNVEPKFSDNVLYIGMKRISLPRNYHPTIGEDCMSIEEKERKRIERNVLSEKESKGEWDIIYSASDSVIFKAPNHPLEGRYGVRIFLENMHECMILSNDSTYLVCYRAGY